MWQATLKIKRHLIQIRIQMPLKPTIPILIYTSRTRGCIFPTFLLHPHPLQSPLEPAQAIQEHEIACEFIDTRYSRERHDIKWRDTTCSRPQTADRYKSEKQTKTKTKAMGEKGQVKRVRQIPNGMPTRRKQQQFQQVNAFLTAPNFK